MKRTWIGAIILVAVAGGIAFRLLSDKQEPVQYERRPTVSVEEPRTGDITLYTEVIGLIEPQSKVTVLPKMGGELLEVHFQAGDYVETGQVLCKINSDALTSLQLSLNSAEIAMQDANTALHRTQMLYNAGGVAKSVLEQAQSGANNAKIAYEASKNQYDLHVQYMTITAPISGYVESRNVNVHDMVGNGTAICVISANDQFQVNFGITEKVFQNLAVGDFITVEKSGMEYQGEITEINSMVNVSNGLYDVKAVIPDVNSLTTGTRVKLTVIMEQVSGVITVPVDAVNYNNGIAFVYCYEDGIAVKTEIVPGIYDSTRMEVKAGVAGSSRIITSWSNELVDGAEVIEATSAAN